MLTNRFGKLTKSKRQGLIQRSKGDALVFTAMQSMPIPSERAVQD
jgi:hypothetical protein